MTHRWRAKIPSGHMHLSMSFSVKYRDDDIVVSPTSGYTGWEALKDANLGFSDAMVDFMESCTGGIEIDRDDFSILFESEEDFMRFKLISAPDMEARVWRA